MDAIRDALLDIQKMGAVVSAYEGLYANASPVSRASRGERLIDALNGLASAAQAMIVIVQSDIDAE